MTRCTALIFTAVMLTAIPVHAAFFSFNDELNVTGGGGGRTILDTTDPDFDAIDDTFTGVVTYSFTVNFDALDGGSAVNTFAGFQLYNNTSENLGVTEQWPSANWGYYRAAFQSGGAGDLDNGSGTLAIVTGDPQTFTVTITYVAGGNDSAVITWNGNDNILPTGDYSFDNVHVRAGNNTTQADFTGMSMNIVPEPATLGLVAIGAAGLLLKRRPEF